MDLKDKVAVVTGGASGLGRATVEVFLAKGAKVVIFDLNEVAGQRAAEELGDHCSFEVVNVADEASAKTAIQNVLSTHGALHVAVNCAGIGAAMNIPLPIVAGMVVCGATFGDKMSPVSDTTNLASMSAGTNLYRHMYAMLLTTLPSFLLTLVVFLVIGFSYANQSLNVDEIIEIKAALASHYNLAPYITLLPLVLLTVMSIKKVPAEVTMSSSILLAVIIAIFYQDTNTISVLNALWENTPQNTGIANLDALLGRGGISSMSWTLLLALMAIALGGILHGAGFLAALLKGIIERVKRTATLIAVTIASGFLGNVAMGEAYISIILNCQLFKPKYEQQNLDRAVLSRSVEEGATMTTGLIPWTTAGAFYSATLGVDVLDYAPYAFFNYLNGVIAVTMAALGVGLLKGKTAKR